MSLAGVLFCIMFPLRATLSCRSPSPRLQRYIMSQTCDRLSRLRVLLSDLTPTPPSAGLRIVVPSYPLLAGATWVSQVLVCFSPHVPRPKTPADSSPLSLSGTSLRLLPIVRHRRLLVIVTRLNIFRSGASLPMAHMVPCVRLRHIVRLLTFPL